LKNPENSAASCIAIAALATDCKQTSAPQSRGRRHDSATLFLHLKIIEVIAMSIFSIARYFQWQEQCRLPSTGRTKRRKSRGTSLLLERLESRETPSVSINGITDGQRFFDMMNQSLTIDFTVSDTDVNIPPSSIAVTATSNNTAAISKSNIVISSNGDAREITIIPTNGQVGEADITITASDSNGASTQITLPVLINTSESVGFTDTFGQSFASFLGVGWNELSGSFSVANNVAAAADTSGSGGVDLATVNGLIAGNPDVQATASVAAATNDMAGLVARFNGNGANTMYIAELINEGNGVFDAEIISQVAGNQSILVGPVAVSSATGTNDKLELDVNGQQLNFLVNGQVAASTTDAFNSISAPGSVGITASGTGVTFSNFAVPFSDSFSANGQLGANWNLQMGNFQVLNGSAQGAGSLDIATAANMTAANVNLSANVNVSASGEFAGLIARYSGPGDTNWYWGGLYNNGSSVFAQIYVNVNGNWRLLASTNVGVSGSAPIDFQVEGSSLQLSVNGHVVASASDASLTTGSVGIRTNAGGGVSAFQATTVALNNVSLPFTENFSSTANGQLGANWMNQLGSLTIGSNGIATASGSLDLATLNGVNQANVDLHSSVNVSASGQFAGLVARYSGPGDMNWYWGGLYNNGSGVSAQIYVNVNGNWRLLASANVSASGSTPIEFVVNGSSLQLFVNNQLAVSANDTSLATGTVGIRASAGATISGAFSASIVPQTNVTLPFSDNFSSTVNGQLSSSWLNQVGSFTVANNLVNGASALDIATLNGVNQTNVDLRANVNVAASGQFAGLVARYSGPGDMNWYWGGLYNNGSSVLAQIYVNINGNWRLLASNNVSASGSTPIEFVVNGSSLQLKVNGQLAASASDSELASGTVGIRASAGTSVGSFSASVTSQVAASWPFSDSFTLTGNGQLSANWVSDVGNFTVTSSGNVSAMGSVDVATLSGIVKSNVDLKTNVNVSAVGQAAGLVARYSGSGDMNMYWAGLVDTSAGVQAQIWVNNAGTWRELASANMNVSGSTPIEFIAEGSNLQLFVNGNFAASANDTSLTSGSVGIRTDAGATVSGTFSAQDVTLSNVTTATFNDAFGIAGQLSAFWMNQVGDFTVTASAAAQAMANMDLATLNGVSVANSTLSASVNVGAGQFAGLVSRYSGPGDSNMYFAGILSMNGNFYAQIWANVNGSWSLLSSSTALASGSETLQFQTSGSTLTLSVGGTTVTATDSSISAAGLVGIRASLGASIAAFAYSSP
jgi:hypothetical protein